MISCSKLRDIINSELILTRLEIYKYHTSGGFVISYAGNDLYAHSINY